MRPPRFAVAAFLLVGLSPGVALSQTDSEYRYTIDWTTNNAASWLKYLGDLAGRAEARGLEIGCFEGHSTLWFLENVLTHPDARMACIDVFTDEIEANFDHNVKISGQGGRLTKYKGYSQDVLRGLPYESFDFVYIDGCHLASCVMTDAVLSWDLLRAGGFMIFDDYGLKAQDPPRERPQVAIDAFIAAFGGQIDVREIGSQVVIQKRSDLGEEDRIGRPVVHDPKYFENLRLLIEANKRRESRRKAAPDR